MHAYEDAVGAGVRREVLFIYQNMSFGPAPRLGLYNIYTSVSWGKCLRVPPGTLYRVPVVQTGVHSSTNLRKLYKEPNFQELIFVFAHGAAPVLQENLHT